MLGVVARAVHLAREKINNKIIKKFEWFGRTPFSIPEILKL